MNYQIPSDLRIQKARTTLLLDHPFFGTLLFRLGGKASRSGWKSVPPPPTGESETCCPA
jgi:hypothetical protein